jgi:hypothetical protein
VPARGRDWEDLGRGREHWLAAYGGKGTPAQREARARRAYETGAVLRRPQAGHEPEAVRAGRSATAFLGDGAAFVELGGLDRAEARRVGRYDALVSQLASGRISPTEFERRSRALRPIRGERFSSDPNAVLTRLDVLRARDRETFVYRSGRAA